VRCPGHDEPYIDETIAFMHRKILQQDVEVEIEIINTVGTYLGSLWESKTNMVAVLLEASLAKFHPFFSTEKTVEENVRKKRMKLWENYVEGKEPTNRSASESTTRKEVLKGSVMKIIGSGKFYVQIAGDQSVRDRTCGENF